MCWTIENAPKPNRIQVFGGFVRMKRKELSLTQREVALGLGLKDAVSVSKVEVGRVVISEKYLPRLADLIHVNFAAMKVIFDLDREMRNIKADREAFK